jgi:putative ATPase
MQRETFYEPTTGGYEHVITERLRHWASLRATGSSASSGGNSTNLATD